MSTGHEAINPIHPTMVGKLDPEFEKMYNEHVANTPNRPIDLPLLRQNYNKIYSYGIAPAPEIKSIEDITFKSFDGVPVKLRIYKPNGFSETEKLPVHIDFHGGGAAVGDLDTEAHILKEYVERARIAVVDVEYRLIPDYKFPTGVKDCFEAVKYVFENAETLGFNKNSISVGGVSAGGHISLAVDHLCRDIGLKLVLICAGTPQIADISNIPTAQDSPYDSIKECEFAPTLNWARLKWFDNIKWQWLEGLTEEQKKEELDKIGWLRDLTLATNFKDLTKTLVFTAGLDPMRSEGLAYAKILMDHGVEVVYKCYEGVPHPFQHMNKNLWQARDFIYRTALELALAHKTLTF
ncbi:hypothetical protein OGAPHI_000555 [Ogataea philodendri]|uniref:Alpha/beta hydrolase fold-3 domain-containing protein n=1 Tax=Ogataea philodendri TaxID=1378263 RepID=A0A9P8PGA6_9ASCO|nr:uncharacterized protein OGAPHI_000555 [Ogataea philodendri]KAH3671332.1 hypothetical protein OGAPHI_000555 [Ogataea philodendri]